MLQVLLQVNLELFIFEFKTLLVNKNMQELKVWGFKSES